MPNPSNLPLNPNRFGLAPERLASVLMTTGAFILNLPITMFAKPQMIDLPAEKQAEKAIAHTLRNIAERPGVAWHLGYGTQTYALLTESLATLSGKGMDEIQSIYPPADQPNFADNHNTCPFCGSHALSGECDSDKEKHYMTCTDCGATGPTVIEWHHDSEKDAINTAVRKWNERQMPR